MESRRTGVEHGTVAGLRVTPDTTGRARLGERSVRYLAGFGTGVRFGVHSDTAINMARGITERVLYVVRDGRLSKPPQPRAGVFERLSGIRQRLLRKTISTPIVDRDDYPMLYTGRKRGVYQAAVDSLKQRGLTVKDSYVDTFLKAEKINFDAKGDPAPRVIQPRSPRYNVEVGRYLKLFEKECFRAFQRVWKYPVVLKGLNAQQVGGWMKQHWDSFERPVAIGLDASRFDQHVSRAALEWEHSVYNGVFQSRELRQLLRMQLRNRGIARVDGLRFDYETDGCRMSGDINTGLGNCLIMSSIVIAYCEHVGIQFRLANNGDDCVVFCDRRDERELDGLESWFLDFGFTLTRESPCYELEHVEFCQFHPVCCGNGWRMVRDPRVAMSKDCVALVGWDKESEVRAWAHAIGSCGISLTRGVPVWEAWYHRLLRVGEEASAGVRERVAECGLSYAAAGVQACSVTEECRYSFYKAFGILPDLQVALEAEYAHPCELTPITPVTSSHVTAIDNSNPLTLWRKLT